MWLFLVLFSSCVVLCVGEFGELGVFDLANYGIIVDETLSPSSDITTECGPNEEFSCVTSCPPEKTCLDREDYACLEFDEVCSYKCVCKEGFYRNAAGECITEAVCDQCLGANEYNACDVPCDTVCATLNIQNKTSCPKEYLEGECKFMCYCDDGYARDEFGNCIPIEECQCQPNEVFSCVNSCLPEKTCRDHEIYECLEDDEVCGYKCVCKEGFYRNATGECIHQALCDQCPGVNEYYACDAPCDNVCATLNIQNKTSCPEKYLECKPMCYCDDGYARDEFGNCIPIEECRVYNNTNLFLPDDGEAQKEECGLNEEFSCVTSCPPERMCGEYDNISCPETETGCEEYKCTCKEGFYRNSVGECITQKQCEKCPGANEHYACGGSCDNVCATLHLQNKTSCAQERLESGCQASCYCNDGYARNKSGHCILLEECPLLGCGSNEIKTDCITSCSTFIDLMHAIFTNEPCRQHKCEPGCVCKSGYVRKYPNSIDSPCIHVCEHPVYKIWRDCP